MLSHRDLRQCQAVFERPWKRSHDNEVTELLAAFAHSLTSLLLHPVVAAIVGLAVGVGLLVFSRMSFGAMRSDAPEVGLAVAGVLLVVRMAAAAGILVAYRAFAPAGFVPFASAMAGGFLVAYTVELLRFSKAPGSFALHGHSR